MGGVMGYGGFKEIWEKRVLGKVIYDKDWRGVMDLFMWKLLLIRVRKEKIRMNRE